MLYPLIEAWAAANPLLAFGLGTGAVLVLAWFGAELMG